MERYKSIFEDTIIDVYHFGTFEGLENESVIIFEDAYGERTIKKIFTKDLEQELKGFQLIKNKENEQPIYTKKNNL